MEREGATKETVMPGSKADSLGGGSGVHVFLVLWKAASAVQSYAEDSISELEMCGSDFAVLEALLHKGPLLVNEIGKKVLLTSGSITVAVDGHAADLERLASASLTMAERKTLIRLLKKIGYEAAKSKGVQPAEVTRKVSKGSQ